MTLNIVTSNRPQSPNGYTRKAELDLYQAQQVIYNTLLAAVKAWPPEDVLEEFRQLFIEHTDTISSDTIPALQVILFANDEREFQNTLKRSCYILVNNWEVARQFQAIQLLIEQFNDPILYRKTLSPTLKRLRQWIINFVESKDFRDLALFVARFSEERTLGRSGEWVSRYTSYLLVPQYINPDNPIEQRHAARTLSRRLKDKFKFELAMYTAYSQSALPRARPPRNPTALGDSALRLIKAIVAKRGEFSYKNLANLFAEQVKDLSYAGYKRGLVEYLLFTVQRHPVVGQLKATLVQKLAQTYPEYDDSPIDRSLVLRTSNRIIDFLMTEDQKNPSALFTLILSQGNSLTLAVILLKTILISRNSLPYLEARIADLINYYEQFPRDRCQWVINFLEIFQVTFAIYSENVEYNLVRVNAQASENGSPLISVGDLETCRIFSRLLRQSHVETEEDEDLSWDEG